MIFLNKVISLSLLICFIFTTPVYSHKIKSGHKLRVPLISSKDESKDPSGVPVEGAKELSEGEDLVSERLPEPKDEVEKQVALWVKENCQSLRKEGVEVTPAAEYFLNVLFMNRDVLKACSSLLNHCILKKPVLRILQKFADTPSGMADVDGIAKSALAVVSNPEPAKSYLAEKLNLTDPFNISLSIPTKKLSMSSEELLSQARENFFMAVVGADDMSKIISRCLEPMLLGRRLESSDGTEYLCKFYYSPDENKLSGLLFVEGGRVLVQEIDLRLKTLRKLEGTFEKGEAFFDLHGIEVSSVCQAIGYIRNVCFLVGLDFVINIDPTPSYRFLRESLKEPAKGQLSVKDHQTASDGSRVSSLLFSWIFNPLFKGCLSLQELVMSDNGIYEPDADDEQSLFVGLQTQDEEILNMSDKHILREYIDLASMIQEIRGYLSPIVPYQPGEEVYITLWDVGPDYGAVPTAIAKQIIAATSITIRKGYWGYLLRKRHSSLHIEVDNRTLMREMSHHVSTLVRKMDEQVEIYSTSGTGLYYGCSEIIDGMFYVFEQAGSMPPYESWGALFEYDLPYDSGHEVIGNLVGKLAENLRKVDPFSYKEHDRLLDTEMPLDPSRIYDRKVPLPDSFVATARRVIDIKPRPIPGAWVYGKLAFKEEIGQAYIDTMSKIGVPCPTVPFLSTTTQLEAMMEYGRNEFKGVDVPAEQQKEFLEYKKSVMDKIQRLKGENMKAVLKAKFPSLASDRIEQLVRMVSDNLFKNLGLKYLDLLGCKEEMRKIMIDYFSLYACASSPEYKIPLSKRDTYDEIISGTSARLSSEMKKSPLVYVGCDGSKEPTMLAWLERPNVLEKIVTGEIIVVNGMLQLREGMLTSVANCRHDI